MTVKFNYAACREPSLISTESINRMVANLARIGIQSITPDTIQAVIKRTNLANECNLQIAGFIITPISIEEIQRMLWFTTNVEPMTPQKWFSLMRKNFPYVLEFNRELKKRVEAGWEVIEYPNHWVLSNPSDKTISTFVYPIEKYLTEKSVWQDAMSQGRI